MTNAGFKIVEQCVKARENDTVDGVALGWKETSFGDQWVTWAFTDHPAEERSYYWGHYFTDETTAKIDYHKRALKMYGEV